MRKGLMVVIGAALVLALGFWAGRRASRRPPAGRGAPVKSVAEGRGERIIWDFEEPGSTAEWQLSDNMAAAPAAEHATSGESSVRLDWPGTQTGLPGFKYEGGVEDLSKWGYLKFDAFNPGDTPVLIHVKLKSTDHGKQTTLNYTILPTEEKTVSIRLDALARQLDLSDVMYFNIFVWQPREPGSLFVDAIRVTE